MNNIHNSTSIDIPELAATAVISSPDAGDSSFSSAAVDIFIHKPVGDGLIASLWGGRLVRRQDSITLNIPAAMIRNGDSIAAALIRIYSEQIIQDETE